MEITSQQELDKAISDGAKEIHIATPGKYKASNVYISAERGVTLFADNCRISSSECYVEAYNSIVIAHGGTIILGNGSYASGSLATVYAYGRSTVNMSESFIQASSGSAVLGYGSRFELIGDSYAFVGKRSTATGRHASIIDNHGVVYSSEKNTVSFNKSVSIDSSGIPRINSSFAHSDALGRLTYDKFKKLYDRIYNLKRYDDRVLVYKAVNDNFTTDRGFDYTPGAMPACDDYVPNNKCGGGLHFSPTPAMARVYFPDATRFVGAWVSEYTPITGDVAKVKAPRVVCPIFEVDVFGRPC